MLQDSAASEAATGPKLRLKTLERVDGRTRAHKRARRLAATFAAALGGDLTDGQRYAVNNAAVLCVIAEDAQARRLAGDVTTDLDKVTRLSNAAARALRELGLPQRAPLADQPRDRKRRPSKPAAASLTEMMAKMGVAR